VAPVKPAKLNDQLFTVSPTPEAVSTVTVAYVLGKVTIPKIPSIHCKLFVGLTTLTRSPAINPVPVTVGVVVVKFTVPELTMVTDVVLVIL
jgi:hypothetical protein